MKPENYKSINATSTVDVRSINLPFKMIDGEIMYVDPRTGLPLSTDLEQAQSQHYALSMIRYSCVVPAGDPVPKVRNTGGIRS